MTSPDGINWTTRTNPLGIGTNSRFMDVVWSPGAGLFVAVSRTSDGYRVITSPNGINWTARKSAADNEWYGVCWSSDLDMFVAVASTGTGNRVMTSI